MNAVGWLSESSSTLDLVKTLRKPRQSAFNQTVSARLQMIKLIVLTALEAVIQFNACLVQSAFSIGQIPLIPRYGRAKVYAPLRQAQLHMLRCAKLTMAVTGAAVVGLVLPDRVVETYQKHAIFNSPSKWSFKDLGSRILGGVWGVAFTGAWLSLTGNDHINLTNLGRAVIFVAGAVLNLPKRLAPRLMHAGITQTPATSLWEAARLLRKPHQTAFKRVILARLQLIKLIALTAIEAVIRTIAGIRLVAFAMVLVSRYPLVDRVRVRETLREAYSQITRAAKLTLATSGAALIGLALPDRVLDWYQKHGIVEIPTLWSRFKPAVISEVAGMIMVWPAYRFSQISWRQIKSFDVVTTVMHQFIALTITMGFWLVTGAFLLLRERQAHRTVGRRVGGDYENRGLRPPLRPPELVDNDADSDYDIWHPPELVYNEADILIRLDRRFHGERDFGNAPTRLTINNAVLNEQPLSILSQVRARLFSGRFDFKITFIESDGRASAGVDAGGLNKMAMTRIVHSLVKRGIDGPFILPQLRFLKTDTDEAMPNLGYRNKWLTEKIEGFHALGALLAVCATQDYPTGTLFHLDLYEMMLNLSNEDLDAISSDTREISHELRGMLNLIQQHKDKTLLQKSLFLTMKPQYFKQTEYNDLVSIVEACYDEEESGQKPKNLQEMTLENIQWALGHLKSNATVDQEQSDTVLPVVLIAKGMQSVVGPDKWNEWRRLRAQGLQGRDKWNEWRSLRAQGLQGLVQGRSTSKEVIRAIVWMGKNSPETAAWVIKWIEAASQKKLEDLLFTITGLRALSSDPEKKLKFYLYMANNPNKFPNVHSCNSSIDLPANYPSERIFREKLEYLIAQSTNPTHSGVEEI